MKLLLIILLAVEVFCYEDLSFDEWQAKHGFKFNNVVEKNHRERIFLKRKSEIEAHNANPANTYKKALNQFSHLEGDEFITSRCKTVLPSSLAQLAVATTTTTTKPTTTTTKSTTTTSKPTTTTTKPTTTTTKPTTTTTTTSTQKPNTYPFGNYNSTNAPASVDFRYLMEPVQDQGQCGSCWAFATMGQLEGMMRIRNSTYNTVLGPQYLVDCDLSDSGCNGGWPATAMNWLKSNGNNASSMTSYPYTAVRGTCKTGTTKTSLGINTVTGNYFAGNEAALKAQVANYGPQVVAIYATANFQSYSSGVLYDATCPSGTLNCNNVNHAVIVTGYGTDPIYGDYWQIKNSWSSRWGESGYVRLARNRNNNCNVACWPTFSM